MGMSMRMRSNNVIQRTRILGHGGKEGGGGGRIVIVGYLMSSATALGWQAEGRRFRPPSRPPSAHLSFQKLWFVDTVLM